MTLQTAVPSTSFYALRKIRKYSILDKTKLLGNAFIDEHFNYFQFKSVICLKTFYIRIFTGKEQPIGYFSSRVTLIKSILDSFLI